MATMAELYRQKSEESSAPKGSGGITVGPAVPEGTPTAEPGPAANDPVQMEKDYEAAQARIAGRKDQPASAQPSMAELYRNAGKTVAVQPLVPRQRIILANRKEQEDRAHRLINRIDPDIDVDGLNFMDRWALGQADTPEEKKQYLDQKYGKGASGEDSFGNIYVKKDGKKVLATPGLTGSVAAMAPELVAGGYGALEGAAAGGALGGPLAPLTAFGGGVIGAALGTGVGKAATEGAKLLANRSNKTPAGTMQSINEAMLQGAAGEAVGRPVVGALSRLARGPVPSALTGTTPETQNLTALTTRGGAVPPIKSALPTAKKARWMQEFSQNLVGPFKDTQARNQAFIDQELRDILKSGGIPPSQVDAVFDEIANPRSAVSTKELGEDLQRTTRAHVAALEANVDAELAEARRVLEQQGRHLDALMRRYQPGDLGVDVAQGIRTARADFSRAASRIYQRIDRLVGDTPLVPTHAMRQEAQRIAQHMPQSETRNIVHEIADLQVPTISFADAQRLRTRLRELSASPNLTPGAIKGDFSRLESAVDVSFNQAMRFPQAAPAVNMLRAADRFYREGITRFKNTAVNQLAQEIRAGTPHDPDVIADMIVKPGNLAQVRLIRDMLPADVWNRVGAASYDNLIRDVTREVDGRAVVQGRKLLDYVQQNRNLLDAVHGRARTDQIEQYARRIAALDGDIPAQLLHGDTFADTLRFYQQNIEMRDEFLKQNFLSALADPKKMPDDALRFIVQPRQEARLEQALKFFGDPSPQVDAIRQTALKSLLASTVENTETGVARGVAGGGLEKALKGYTRKQQEMLFPNGLADDIRLIAQEAKFLFPPTEADMGGVLAAAAIKAMPFGTAYPMMALPALYGYILSRPTTIKYLALGLRGDGPVRAATREALRTAFRAALLGPTADVEQNP